MSLPVCSELDPTAPRPTRGLADDLQIERPFARGHRGRAELAWRAERLPGQLEPMPAGANLGLVYLSEALAPVADESSGRCASEPA